MPGPRFTNSPASPSKVKAEVSVEKPKPSAVTSTVPGACGGVTTVISFALMIWMSEPEVASNSTSKIGTVLLPVIVTSVPPAAGPDDGLIESTSMAWLKLYS